MMIAWSKYLLRTLSQCESFRTENEGLVRERYRAFADWIQGMPWMKWMPLRFRTEQEARAAIGLICLLYADGEVNISFRDDMSGVRHEPRTEKEIEAWTKAAGYRLFGTGNSKTVRK